MGYCEVGPHPYEPISWFDRVLGSGGRCVACYEPECAHPISAWVRARPMGSRAPANWPHGYSWPQWFGFFRYDGEGE